MLLWFLLLLLLLYHSSHYKILHTRCSQDILFPLHKGCIYKRMDSLNIPLISVYVFLIPIPPEADPRLSAHCPLHLRGHPAQEDHQDPGCGPHVSG